MWASLAGRLDPETGAMFEYFLPPEARPHTIVPDADGNIWYTGNSNATIGKLDPMTSDITEYHTQARDPHSAVFHPNGRFYFTAQGAGMLGRLEPQTGELTEIQTEPRPYGMQVAADGTIWVAYNGTNKLGALDPDTMEVRYFEVPDEASRIRRLGLTSDGMVWYGNSHPRPHRTAQSADWRGQGVAVTQWPGLPPLCVGRGGRCHLVQRVGDATRRPGPVRSENRTVSELGDSVRRGYRPEHVGH